MEVLQKSSGTFPPLKISEYLWNAAYTFLPAILMHSEKCLPSFAGSCACLVFTGDTVLLNLLVRAGSIKLTEDSLSTASIFDESMVLAWKEIKQRSVWLSFTFCTGTWICSFPIKEREPSPAVLVLWLAGQVRCGAVAITPPVHQGLPSITDFKGEMNLSRWNQQPKQSLFSGGRCGHWF